MFSPWTEVEKQEELRVFTGKDSKKNKIVFFVLTCGLCSLKAVVSWQKFALARQFQPESSGLASLTETGLPPSLLHPSHIGRNTVLFCCPVNSSHTKSQSRENYPKSEGYPILCPGWKSWERKDPSASWQVLSSIPPGSFLFRFNFLPRKWSLWAFCRIRISTFITGNYLKKI